jgi:hypothetical protein
VLGVSADWWGDPMRMIFDSFPGLFGLAVRVEFTNNHCVPCEGNRPVGWVIDYGRQVVSPVFKNVRRAKVWAEDRYEVGGWTDRGYGHFKAMYAAPNSTCPHFWVDDRYKVSVTGNGPMKCGHTYVCHRCGNKLVAHAHFWPDVQVLADAIEDEEGEVLLRFSGLPNFDWLRAEARRLVQERRWL